MPTAQHWRITQISTTDGSLDLGDVMFYSWGVVQTPSSVSTTLPSDHGSYWGAEKVSNSVFAIQWTFQAPVQLEAIRFGAKSASGFPHGFALHRSTDGVNWLGVLEVSALDYPGAGQTSAKVWIDDPYPASEVDPLAQYDLLRVRFENGELRDTSPNPKTLSMVGSASISSNARFGNGCLYRPSTAGSGVSFTNPQAFAFGLGDFTVECWMRRDSTIAYAVGVSDNSTPSSGWYLGANSANGANFMGYGSGAITGITTGAGTMTTGVWHHVAACRRNGQFYLYVDGKELHSSYRGTYNMVINPKSKITVGQIGSYNQSFPGPFPFAVDDVRITRAARYGQGNFDPPDIGRIVQSGYSGVLASHTNVRFGRNAGTVSASTIPDAWLATPPAHGVVAPGAGGVSLHGTVHLYGKPVNTPLRRRVRLHDKRDMRLIRETWSDAETGAFRFDNIDPTVPFIAITYDHTGRYCALGDDSIRLEG